MNLSFVERKLKKHVRALSYAKKALDINSSVSDLMAKAHFLKAKVMSTYVHVKFICICSSYLVNCRQRWSGTSLGRRNLSPMILYLQMGNPPGKSGKIREF